MSLHAWFANDDVEVAPGSTLDLTLCVQNLEDTADSVAIVPVGPASSWINLPSRELDVPAGKSREVLLRLTPPELPTTTAGPTTVAVRVIPRDERIDVSAETTIDVLPFDDRRIVALQPVQRARRRATYEFMVENEGNNMASCRLHLVDVTGRVDGSFDPPAVGVGPGESSFVQLRTKARRGLFRRATRTLEFDVEAEQMGHRPARSTFALVQPSTLPRGLIVRTFAVLAAVGLAVAAWYAVVRTEIRDAATEEVDRLVSEIDGASTAPETNVDTGIDTATEETESAEGAATASEFEAAATDSVTADGGADPGDGPQESGEERTTGKGDVANSTAPATKPAKEGVPDFERLKVEAPLTQTADATYTVPTRQTFDLTDVRVENPFNDSGIATLLVNGKEVFLWSLDNIRGSYFEPSITQKRLKGGDNVTFSVRCDEISDPFRSTCTNAVNVGGVVYRK